MKGFDGYLFLLPTGAGGHGDDPDRLRSAAELQVDEGWLLGCRDELPGGTVAHTRQRVAVTPLGTAGRPVGRAERSPAFGGPGDHHRG